jgi:putative FmdB family regulatory protein
MPIREFRCENDHLFEVLVRSTDEEYCCPECGSDKLLQIPSTFATRNEAIHPSERPVIFRNPNTGEIRYPASKDQPLDPKFAAQGYVREEAFSTFSGRDSFEKTTGRIHERSHYDPGSATAERDLAPPDPEANLKKLKRVHPRV